MSSHMRSLCISAYSDLADIKGWQPSNSHYLLYFIIKLSLIDVAYHQPISLSVHIGAPICLSSACVCTFILNCMSVRLSVCLFIYLHTCMFVCLSFSLFPILSPVYPPPPESECKYHPKQTSWLCQKRKFVFFTFSFFANAKKTPKIFVQNFKLVLNLHKKILKNAAHLRLM